MRVKLSLVASALAMSATMASAADFSPVMTSPAVAPAPTTIYAPTFDWAGPYVGAYGGYTFGLLGPSAGAQAGYNFVNGNFLTGVEVQAGVAIGGPAFEGWTNGRVGAVLGSNFLLYGEAGIGMIGLGDQFLWAAGGGAEVALGRSVSLFAEAKVLGDFGDCCAYVGQGGLNWRPGN